MRQRALERLDEHQAEILLLLQGAAAMLTERVGDVAELARARWTLMRALTAYQLFKHREIFDPAIACPGVHAAQAARMKAACLTLGEGYRRHVQQWSATDVEAHWPAYRAAALAIVARIRGHIARERAEVAVMLAGR